MLALAILVAICALYGMSIPLTIGAIGKPRRPITHGLAIFSVVVSILAIAGLAYVAGQL